MITLQVSFQSYNKKDINLLKQELDNLKNLIDLKQHNKFLFNQLYVKTDSIKLKKIKNLTILKSPHIHKKARNQFVLNCYKIKLTATHVSKYKYKKDSLAILLMFSKYLKHTLKFDVKIKMMLIA